MLSGREFKILSPENVNALSPYFLDYTGGVDNKLDELDLNMRAGVYGTIRSFIVSWCIIVQIFKTEQRYFIINPGLDGKPM